MESGIKIQENDQPISVQKQFMSTYVNDKCISQCFRIEDLYTLKPMAQIVLEMSQWSYNMHTCYFLSFLHTCKERIL